MSIHSYSLGEAIRCIQSYNRGKTHRGNAEATLFYYAFESAGRSFTPLQTWHTVEPYVYQPPRGMENHGAIAGSYPERKEAVNQAIDNLLNKRESSTANLAAEIDKIKKLAKHVIQGAMTDPKRPQMERAQEQVAAHLHRPSFCVIV